VSSLLKELTERADDILFEEGQEEELKGLAGPNRVYSVDWKKPTVAPERLSQRERPPLTRTQGKSRDGPYLHTA